MKLSFHGQFAFILHTKEKVTSQSTIMFEGRRKIGCACALTLLLSRKNKNEQSIAIVLSSPECFVSTLEIKITGDRWDEEWDRMRRIKWHSLLIKLKSKMFTACWNVMQRSHPYLMHVMDERRLTKEDKPSSTGRCKCRRKRDKKREKERERKEEKKQQQQQRGKSDFLLSTSMLVCLRPPGSGSYRVGHTQ